MKFYTQKIKMTLVKIFFICVIFQWPFYKNWSVVKSFVCENIYAWKTRQPAFLYCFMYFAIREAKYKKMFLAFLQCTYMCISCSSYTYDVLYFQV